MSSALLRIEAFTRGCTAMRTSMLPSPSTVAEWPIIGGRYVPKGLNGFVANVVGIMVQVPGTTPEVPSPVMFKRHTCVGSCGNTFQQKQKVNSWNVASIGIRVREGRVGQGFSV